MSEAEMSLALPNPKTAALSACDSTLTQIESILPQADEQQTDAILDWVRMFMEARRLRELWAKTSKLLRMAEVRWGELHPPQQGRRTDLETSEYDSEVAPDTTTARQFRTMAENREIVEDVIEKAGDRIVTRSEVLREINVHFSSNSAEHYTPEDMLQQRIMPVLGEIDLDPCSDEKKNVPALHHYTKQDDGLALEWYGRIFMNPPYGNEIDKWIDKLLAEFAAGRTSEAIALLPARVDTRWFNKLTAFPVCFIRGRLKFKGNRDAAPFPSAVFYFGDHEDFFIEQFSDIGAIWKCIA